MAQGNDVTQILVEASKQLGPGQMIHGETFSLSKIMNAVEIGDPRLDAGMRSVEMKSRAVKPLPTDLNPQQVLAIMDYLMRLEATWLSGSNLGQTVYTCRYIIEQERVQHLPDLSAFLYSIKAFAKFLADLVVMGCVVAEEEVVAYQFGYDFQLGTAYLAHIESLLLKAKDVVSDRSVQARLQFRRLFSMALAAISRNTKNDVENGRKLLYKAMGELRDVVIQDPEDPTSVPEGFDPELNRERCGPMAPRKVSILNGDQTKSLLNKLLEDLAEVCRVTQMTCWADLEKFLGQFSKRGASPIARSMLSQLLIADPLPGSQWKTWQPSPAMVQHAVGLPEPLSKAAPNKFPELLKRMHIMMQNMATNRCLNTSRQRRKYRRAVDDWVVLMQEASEVEGSPSYHKWLNEIGWQWGGKLVQPRLQGKGPILIWMELECCKTILQHLFLGFELECYMPHEFSMIYWYCEHLLGIVVENANVLGQKFPKAAGSPAASPGSKRRGQSKQAASPPRLQPQATDFLSQGRIASTERALCRAYNCVALGLLKLNAIKKRPGPFNSDEHVYEQRFFYLHPLPSPTYVNYPEYEQMTNGTGSDPFKLLQHAIINFQEARISAANLVKETNVAQHMVTNIEQLERMAKQNGVAVQLLSSDLGKQIRALLLELQSKEIPDIELQNKEMPDPKLTWNCVFQFPQGLFFPLLRLTKQ